MNYAINYVLGRASGVIVVDASDRDEAYSEARAWLRRRRLTSAALQGSCRPATGDDMNAWAAQEGSAR